MKYFSQIPKSIADEIILGGEMQSGLTKDGQALNIKQIDAAQMKTATDALIEADKNFNDARSAQQLAYDNFHVADDAVTQWLGDATGVLSASYGKRWNAQWVQVGFITPSIRIPSTNSERLALTLRMVNFFTANPDKEAANQGVTAAKATTLRAAAVSTQGLAAAADVDMSDKSTARDAAQAALTSQMRMLIGVLGELLNADDPRWLDFGLEIPAKLTTPPAPSGLNVTVSPAADASNVNDPDTVLVLLTCDASPTATRYRFRMRIVGVLGSKFELVASTTEPMAQVAVPANATVEFIAQAVNGNRQSVASEAFVFTPNASVTKTASALPVVAAITGEMPAATATNGSNGHANGSRLPVRAS